MRECGYVSRSIIQYTLPYQYLGNHGNPSTLFPTDVAFMRRLMPSVLGLFEKYDGDFAMIPMER